MRASRLLAAAALAVAALTSCGATRITVEYTAPAYHRASSGCDPDSLRPIAAAGIAMLYGREFGSETWRFLAAKDLTDSWGQADRFQVNLKSVQWLLRLVTAVGDSVSCPSNEVYKDARKQR